MAALRGPLSDLLPEIYPIIIDHLPLYATPSTLLALALTCRDVSQNALPLLYSRLILKEEDNAITVLQRLADNPSLGLIVRELHIMSGLSFRTRKQDPPMDVIRRVGDLISRGYLPFVHTLGLYLMKGWYYDPDSKFEAVSGFGQLRGDPWLKIKEKCPRLSGVILEGFRDDPDDPWAEESGVLQLDGITHLQTYFNGSFKSKGSTDKILSHISSLSHSLHTLRLGLSPGSSSVPTSPIFNLNLPCLRSLSLAKLTELSTIQAMAFFERHPAIECLEISSNCSERWFSPNLPPNLLPNLRHLNAHWSDVRLLAPILGQLRSLAIRGSVNAQIPYLFRFVLPNGLPNLQSLSIGQAPSSSRHNKNIEGALWYENPDGSFAQAKNKGSRNVFDGYIHSIGSAAPNLEELMFCESLFRLSQFALISRDLNCLSRLKHLYHEDYYASLEVLTEFEKTTFSSHARELAEAVPGLVSITNVSTTYLPYLTARIRRTDAGEVVSVEVGKGYGMKIGHEDAAFPR